MIIDCFLKFLQKNNVFPDIDKKLSKAIAITEKAIRELPDSLAVNKIIPDDFGRGCRQLFGSMNGYNVWNTIPPPENDAQGGRASKKRRTDDVSSDVVQTSDGPAFPRGNTSIWENTPAPAFRNTPTPR